MLQLARSAQIDWPCAVAGLACCLRALAPPEQAVRLPGVLVTAPTHTHLPPAQEGVPDSDADSDGSDREQDAQPAARAAAAAAAASQPGSDITNLPDELLARQAAACSQAGAGAQAQLRQPPLEWLSDMEEDYVVLSK